MEFQTSLKTSYLKMPNNDFEIKKKKIANMNNRGVEKVS